MQIFLVTFGEKQKKRAPCILLFENFMGIYLSPAQKFVNLGLHCCCHCAELKLVPVISVGDPSSVAQIQQINRSMTVFHCPFALYFISQGIT